MFQGGETEFCERIRKIYGKGVMYNPMRLFITRSLKIR